MKDYSVTYVIVNDNTSQHGTKQWVPTKYVKLYPQLYIPVIINGHTLTSEICNNK